MGYGGSTGAVQPTGTFCENCLTLLNVFIRKSEFSLDKAVVLLDNITVPKISYLCGKL